MCWIIQLLFDWSPAPRAQREQSCTVGGFKRQISSTEHLTPPPQNNLILSSCLSRFFLFECKLVLTYWLCCRLSFQTVCSDICHGLVVLFQQASSFRRSFCIDAPTVGQKSDHNTNVLSHFAICEMIMQSVKCGSAETFLKISDCRQRNIIGMLWFFSGQHDPTDWPFGWRWVGSGIPQAAELDSPLSHYVTCYLLPVCVSESERLQVLDCWRGFFSPSWILTKKKKTYL